MSEHAEQNTSRILLKPAVRARLGGLSDTTLWRMERRGEFPKGIKLSPGRIGYLETDVEAFIAQRAKAAGR